MQCLLPLADAAAVKMCIWLSNKWQWSANEKIEFSLYQTRLVPSSSTQKVTMHGYCTLKIRICDGLMVTRGICPYLAYSLEYTQTHRISVHPADAEREHVSEAKVPTLRFVKILVCYPYYAPWNRAWVNHIFCFYWLSRRLSSTCIWSI